MQSRKSPKGRKEDAFRGSDFRLARCGSVGVFFVPTIIRYKQKFHQRFGCALGKYLPDQMVKGEFFAPTGRVR
ncbi:hypothetical protein QTP88_015807 [Uroleucon formosanum]